MCDGVSSTALLLPYSGIGSPNSRFSRSCSISRVDRTLHILTRNLYGASSGNGGYCCSQLISACFRSNEAETNTKKSTSSLKISGSPVRIASGEYDFHGDLGFKERGKEQIELESAQSDRREKEKSKREKGINIGDGPEVDDRSSNATASAAVNFIEFNSERGDNSMGRLKDEGLVSGGVDSKLEELEQIDGGPVSARKRRQLLKRSSMLAKQVISMQSALSMGFVSQLWVDTVSCAVSVVEVRPNLLSGELERFFLEDVNQVGDVVLIQDESVMENEVNILGLETLVGYNVVTPCQQSIGKVRGYNFDINSGAIESLELDSFGVSIIPSSLVSTYALLVEDVLEVVSDTVIVHEAAASHIQRLTKGFWGSQKLGKSIDEIDDYSNLERQPVRFDHSRGRQRSFGSRKFHQKMRGSAEDWELPMDYL